MTDYHEIYASKAAAYQKMVAAEDCDRHLVAALQELSRQGGTAVDVGAGTGRVTRILLATGMTAVIGVEPAQGMLAEAHNANIEGAEFRKGDALSLPVDNDVADLVVAGWVFGHFTGWYPDDWPSRLDAALAELDRVGVPGAQQVILETMGTGTDAPGPPTPGLAAYYSSLRALGFEQTVIATDYLFPDAVTAASSVRFFFGDALANRLLANDERRLPEWTGLWARVRP